MLKGHQCSALTQCVVTWTCIMSRGISNWPQFKIQPTGNLRQTSKWSWNNNTFVREWKRPISMLVERIFASEIFFAMHWAHHWILARGFSVFDFHSFSFSRLPILHHRGRDFGGCKSPFSRLSCFYSRTQHTTAPFFLPSPNEYAETHESSVSNVTGPLITVYRLARFCVQPEVKLRVFVRLIRREEKLIRELFFFDFHTRTTLRLDQANNKKYFIYTLTSNERDATAKISWFEMILYNENAKGPRIRSKKSSATFNFSLMGGFLKALLHVVDCGHESAQLMRLKWSLLLLAWSNEGKRRILSQRSFTKPKGYIVTLNPKPFFFFGGVDGPPTS